MSEFTRTRPSIRTTKVEKNQRTDYTKRPESGRLFRAYKAGPDTVNMQVFAPIGIGGGFGWKDGKDFAIATAPLSFADVAALRDYLTELLDNPLAEGR